MPAIGPLGRPLLVASLVLNVACSVLLFGLPLVIGSAEVDERVVGTVGLAALVATVGFGWLRRAPWPVLMARRWPAPRAMPARRPIVGGASAAPAQRPDRRAERQMPKRVGDPLEGAVVRQQRPHRAPASVAALGVARLGEGQNQPRDRVV